MFRRLLPILAALALLSPAAIGVAAAAPATAAQRIFTLPLAGTDNTRLFTGYRTTDGLAVRKLVIRSDNLSRLTAADQRALASRDIATVIDFRTAVERALQPDRPVPGAKTEVFDVLGGTPLTTLIDLPSAYRAFVTDPGARSAFRHTLLEIKRVTATNGTVLIHCSAGKDRTGWASAVLLTILGVDRATVERDYLASNTFRHTYSNDAVNGVNIAWLRTSFATADRVYGSFGNYVRRGLGLTGADIAALKSQLLEVPHTHFDFVLRWGR